MRTFGDRMMRPSARNLLLEQLSKVVQKEYLCPASYTPAYLDSIILGNYHNKVPNAHVTYMSISNEKNTLEAKKAIRESCKRYSGNQFLPTLLDAPTGLADLFKIARILYKPAQHLIMVG